MRCLNCGHNDPHDNGSCGYGQAGVVGSFVSFRLVCNCVAFDPAIPASRVRDVFTRLFVVLSAPPATVALIEAARDALLRDEERP